MGLGEINHQEGERQNGRWADPEEGVDETPQTEGTLSIVIQLCWVCGCGQNPEIALA